MRHCVLSDIVVLFNVKAKTSPPAVCVRVCVFGRACVHVCLFNTEAKIKITIEIKIACLTLPHFTLHVID